jgi:hypothetical protein
LAQVENLSGFRILADGELLERVLREHSVASPFFVIDDLGPKSRTWLIGLESNAVRSRGGVISRILQVQRRTWFFAAAVGAAWVLSSGPSVASDPAPDAAAPVGAEQAEGSATEPAAAAFKRSLDRYAAGDLHGALEAMRESHRLSNRTELLYNIARIEEEAGDCPASLADYNRYLQLVPNGRYREAATGASQKLGERCPEQTAPPEPAPSGAPATLEPPTTRATLEPNEQANPRKLAAQPWTPPSAAGWGAIALGAAAGAGAIYFTLAAADAHDRFQSRVDAYKPGSGPLDFSLQHEQHRDQRWAAVLAATGGALVAGGVVVLLLAPRATTPPASTAALYLSPGQLGATFSQRF